MKQLVLLLLTGFSVAVQAAIRAPEVDTYKFNVLLDDKPIGHHSFRIESEGDEQLVEIEANFDVKVLFVTAFRYRHNNTERWQGNCLAEIDSDTTANGKQFDVSGSTVGENFVLKANGDDKSLPACVKTFSYWNPVFLGETQLLNSQTGQYEPVEIIERGEDTLQTSDGRDLIGQRYDIVVNETPISVWYSLDEKRWLGLETLAAGNRRLRYEPAI